MKKDEEFPELTDQDRARLILKHSPAGRRARTLRRLRMKAKRKYLWLGLFVGVPAGVGVALLINWLLLWGGG